MGEEINDLKFGLPIIYFKEDPEQRWANRHNAESRPLIPSLLYFMLSNVRPIVSFVATRMEGGGQADRDRGVWETSINIQFII